VAGADADQPEVDVLGAAKRGFNAILPPPPPGGFTPEQYAPVRPPMAPSAPPAPSGGETRKAADDAAARAALKTYDPNKTPNAAPPGQGAEPRPETGKFGSMTVLSNAPDPATRPGGFAFRKPMGPQEASTEFGPSATTGGHAWTLRTPGAQERQYEDARYSRETKMRQSGEEAEMAKLDAQAAEAAASIARSQELEADPFAPEKAQIAGRVRSEQIKAAPVQSRQAAAGMMLQEYMGTLDSIDEAEQSGKLDAAGAEQARTIAEKRYHNALLAIVPNFRIPKADPFALPAEESATPTE
jgi:hypothetical protein